MIKKSQKNAILIDFIDFLHGIQEDKPIPKETKYVYFVVDFSNNDISLSYSADEKLFDFFDFGAYFPLDAQHFWSQELSAIAVELFDKKTISKKYVLEVLKGICFSAKFECEFLKSRIVIFGERFSKVNKYKYL